jgi:hypothetical protein
MLTLRSSPGGCENIASHDKFSFLGFQCKQSAYVALFLTATHKKTLASFILNELLVFFSG